MRLLLVTISLCELAHCARILAVLPFPSKSHSILHYAIFRLLAERGHELVVYSPYPPPYSVTNLTHIDLPSVLTNMTNTWTFEQFKESIAETNFYGFAIKSLWDMVAIGCEDVFKNQNMKDLLESEQKFDLVFLEASFGQGSLTVFSHKFRAPIINIQGFASWFLTDWIVGNSLSISHIPDIGSFPFTNNMSFKERVQNFLSTLITILYYHFDHLPRQQKIAQQYYKDPSMPHVKEKMNTISITLTNSHRFMEYPRPYTPNMIPIGGAHMSTHMTPLPQEIETFLDDAPEGVIFFSLGTLVPAHIMPKKYIQAFMNAFKQLHQKVLWKTDLTSIPGLPKNIMLTKWVPQPTVLAHPNCVLFLTHGGLFSQHEAFYAGVPVIGIPFSGEQRYNMKFYEHIGAGAKLELDDITEEILYETIRAVISDTRYKENARRVSSIVRDQPMSPADTAVYWVEYVLRHGGAPHLKPATLSLRWYELLSLDVVLALVVILTMMIFIIYYIVERVLKFCLYISLPVSTSKKRD